MISAAKAQANTIAARNKELHSPRFKYAMKWLESKIIEASNAGKTSMQYNICALADPKDKDRCVPPSLRLAISDALSTNGYRYREMSVMNIGGQFNSCFEVSW